MTPEFSAHDTDMIYLREWKSNSGTYLHFSLKQLELGTSLEGRKYMHKKRQRVGQSIVDEIFDQVRKDEFPNKPSIFTSLWIADKYDPSIPGKALTESKQQQGYMYEIKPVSDPVLVAPKWEVMACKAVTQSNLQGYELHEYIKSLARKFWKAEDADSANVHDLLVADGALIVGEVATISRQEVPRS